MFKGFDETALAIEYIRVILQLYPVCINATYFYCLIASVEDSQYNLNALILETLLEMSFKRPELACQCQLFTDLITYVVNACNTNDFCIEAIMQSLLHVLDKTECRALIRFDDLLSSLIAPLVDLEYVPHLYGVDFASHKSVSLSANNASTQPDIENILNACMCALSTMFNSYVGLFCLGTNDMHLLKNLLLPMSWFLNSKTKNSFQHLEMSSSLLMTNDENKKLTKHQQILIRQMTILDSLINFIYKLFKIDSINIGCLMDKERLILKKQNPRVSINSYASQSAGDLFADEFVNSECDELFGSVDELGCQANIYDLIDENENRVSSAPNLRMCFKSYMLVMFIQADLLQSLLNLYFGLPVSFMQNSVRSGAHPVGSMFHAYQNMSLKCPQQRVHHKRVQSTEGAWPRQ